MPDTLAFFLLSGIRDHMRGLHRFLHQQSHLILNVRPSKGAHLVSSLPSPWGRVKRLVPCAQSSQKPTTEQGPEGLKKPT